MLDRNDMLELTRRMNLERNCCVRIAGRYCSEDGTEDGSFNTNFLKLSAEERKEKIAIAKAVLFSKTNDQFREYDLKKNKEAEQFRVLLSGMKECELKNDALLETFYDVVSERYLPRHIGGDYAIFVFYGAYDIKAKSTDGTYLDDSECVYDFLICAFCPIHGDYVPDKPVCGFLWPVFRNKWSDEEAIAVYLS